MQIKLREGASLRVLKSSLAAAFAITLLQPVMAAPAVPVAAPQPSTTVQILFDPPLDTVIRYRSEKTVQKDGKTDMSWSVSDYRFEETEQGYRLTVTPVSFGSNETDPARLAIMKRIDELTRRPFVLRLDADGAIEKLEDADFYWSTIFKVLKEELAKGDSKAPNENAKKMIRQVLSVFENMPKESRLALLTEDVQPLVEFANTEFDTNEPISASVETASPFGGILNREVTISVRKVEGPIASLSIRTSIPRAELLKLVESMLSKFEAFPPERRAEAEAGIAGLEGFRSDTAADYDVSVEDGMLERFRSTETIEVSDKAEKRLKVTTQSMDRID